jgi:nicotinamidase-related amidase
VGPEALLVMDAQNAIVDRFSPSRPAYLKKFIEAARSAGRLVVYVRVAFREGYPEVSNLNKTFRALAAGRHCDFGLRAFHPSPCG